MRQQEYAPLVFNASHTHILFLYCNRDSLPSRPVSPLVLLQDLWTSTTTGSGQAWLREHFVRLQLTAAISKQVVRFSTCWTKTCPCPMLKTLSADGRWKQLEMVPKLRLCPLTFTVYRIKLILNGVLQYHKPNSVLTLKNLLQTDQTSRWLQTR